MIASKYAYIQKYFVLCWYEVTHLSPIICMSTQKKTEQSSEVSLFIFVTVLETCIISCYLYLEHCIPLSALSWNVTRSVSLWWSARPQDSRTPHDLFLSLVVYTQDTAHLPLKIPMIACKQYLHSYPHTLHCNSLVPAFRQQSAEKYTCNTLVPEARENVRNLCFKTWSMLHSVLHKKKCLGYRK